MRWTNVQPKIHLKLNQNERLALRSLTIEERKEVLDQLLTQIRDDLEWIFALETARDAPAARSRAQDPLSLDD
jgi:hypothetical protein